METMIDVLSTVRERVDEIANHQEHESGVITGNDTSRSIRTLRYEMYDQFARLQSQADSLFTSIMDLLIHTTL